MKRARKIVCLAAILALAALAAHAEHTRRWKQSTYDEFLKGTTHGVAVRSDGRLELALKFTQLADADASYLWSVKLDAKGIPYAAGGSPARVVRLDSGGKPATVFQSTDLSAQAIAFDSKGTLYVGTSPDGKVYKVGASGEHSVVFEPKTKYIWDLAFAPDGTLYVATGDKGQIFSVAPDGKSELFYSSDEAHIRVLAFDAQGNLIAGTEPSGRILRLTKRSTKPAANEAAADGFVLYETPKREVTAITVGADGTIYASAIGERQHNAASQLPDRGISARHFHHEQRQRHRRGHNSRDGTSRGAGLRLHATSLRRNLQNLCRWRAGRTLDFARRCRLRAWHWLRTAACLPAPATTARFLLSMVAASSHNLPKPAPRKSPASRAIRREKFFCVLRTRAKSSHSALNMNRKARTNRARSTRNSFRSGAASIGGVRRQQPAQKLRHPISRALNFTFAPATRKIPARSGHAGSAHTANPARPSKRRPRDSCNGKP